MDPLPSNEPIAWRSIFRCVFGIFLDISRAHLNIITHMFRIDTVNKEFVETKDFKNSVEFDLININDGREELHLIDENQHMLKNSQNTIEFKNHCYVAKLPTKRMNELLPDNYTVARKRLDYLEKQLTKNKDLFTDYDKIIKEYLKEGIVEYVENNNNKPHPDKCIISPKEL